MQLGTQIAWLAISFLGGLASQVAPDSMRMSQTIVVDSDASLREAIQDLQPDTILRLKPGHYRGSWHVQDVKNLTVEAFDPKQPPLIEGGGTGAQFSRCENLKLSYLRFKGQTDNGLNIDDGAQYDRPTKGVRLEHIDVQDIGPQGNHDAIKLSGLDQLILSECRISGWGGQAIDMVGCHDVTIRRCQIVGKEGFSQHSGIQCKGGSRDIRIQQCFFRNAGQRPVNAGGSTGLAYFRPPGTKYEAKDITIEGNMFIGSPCACAFVGVDGAKFIGNRVNYPEKWIFRVLQETREDGFVPCRNVLIADNNFIFRREQVRTVLNIGDGTQPETFQFRENRWFAEDQPARSRPKLPSPEADGSYGEDPREIR